MRTILKLLARHYPPPAEADGERAATRPDLERPATGESDPNSNEAQGCPSPGTEEDQSL